MIKNFISKTSHSLDPLPRSHTVTPFRTPSPSSVTYFMDGPLRNIYRKQISNPNKDRPIQIKSQYGKRSSSSSSSSSSSTILKISILKFFTFRSDLYAGIPTRLSEGIHF